MLEQLSAALADLAGAGDSSSLLGILRQRAAEAQFASVALVLFASASHPRDKALDTEGWRRRFLPDLLNGPQRETLSALLRRAKPAVWVTAEDLPGQPELLGQLRAAGVVPALFVPVYVDGRLDMLAAFCGGAEATTPENRQMMALLALPALTYLRALPADEAGEARVHLTEREKQVLQLAATGQKSREIAEQLGMSTRTANQHIDNAGKKLQTRNRPHTVAEALRLGLLA